MPKSIMKAYTTLVVAFSFLWFGIATGQTQHDYSGTTVKNDSGKPLNLISIMDDDGSKMADVFMTGKEMQFNAQQRPIKGSGYVQTLPGKYFHIIFLAECGDSQSGKQRRKQMQIGVSRIEWDDLGTTTSVRGLEPIVRTSSGEEFKITSNLEAPRLQHGSLTVTLEGKGDIALDIKFEDDGTIQKAHQCKLF